MPYPVITRTDHDDQSTDDLTDAEKAIERAVREAAYNGVTATADTDDCYGDQVAVKIAVRVPMKRCGDGVLLGKWAMEEAALALLAAARSL
jgi:hypothetical protein